MLDRIMKWIFDWPNFKDINKERKKSKELLNLFILAIGGPIIYPFLILILGIHSVNSNPSYFTTERIYSLIILVFIIFSGSMTIFWYYFKYGSIFLKRITKNETLDDIYRLNSNLATFKSLIVVLLIVLLLKSLFFD